MLDNKLLWKSSIFFLVLLLFVAFSIYISMNKHKKFVNKVLDNGAKIEWTDCWFNKNKMDFRNYDFMCGWMHTSPSKNSKKSEFSLPVLVLRYKGFNYKKDPVVFMAGGPGSSVLLDEKNLREYWLNVYNKTNFNRDIILYDQRGAGMSRPRLRCHSLKAVTISLLKVHATPKENAKKRYLALKACRDQLRTENAPIDELGTIYSANDLIDMMQLMGYKQWNLQGVSYSTRLAMTVQQKAPSHVRSMVLDSVYPTNKYLFKEWPQLLKQSLERIFTYCQYDKECLKRNGNIEEKFWKLIERYKKDPLLFTIDEEIGMDIIKKLGSNTILISDEILISILFDAQYQSGELSGLPDLIEAFYRKDELFIHSYVLDYINYQFENSLSEAVFWSVECNDSPPFSQEEALSIYKNYPKLSDYLVADYDACNLWRSRYKKEVPQVQENNTVPVLILAGHDDPVTPLEWANETAKIYKKSYLLSFAGIAHSVTDSMPCAYELLHQFINRPDKSPMADCRESDDYFN